MKANSKSTSFRFTEETMALLKMISAHNQRSQTQMIELLIEAEARKIKYRLPAENKSRSKHNSS